MQVISNLDIGGAQEVVRTLSEYLLAEGCAPVVCAFRDGPLRGDIERLGIPVELLPERRHGVLSFHLFLRDQLRLRRELARLVRKHRIDVVQTHLLWSLDFLVASLRFRRRSPLVFWTFHNSQLALRPDQLPGLGWLLRPKRLAHRLLYRLTQRWVDGFIAVSAEVSESIMRELGGAPEKIAVICNGVDLKRYERGAGRARVRQGLGLPAPARLAITVATLKEQKGHRYLIEAASLVIGRFPDLHLAFVGDGALREDLRAQARSLGIAGHVHFLGSRGDVPDLLATSDYFILPSLWEGLPMALVEAMASGLPVVATAVSGTSEVVASESAGILVPPGDAAALARAIAVLLSEPGRARAMGEAARERVRTAFSATKQAREHVALYRRERGLAALPSPRPLELWP